MRRRRARVELARELAVEHRDRDEHADETLRRHRRQQVEVALDQRALGRDRQRMVALGEHLDHGARDLPLALDRLVRVGVGAERDRLAAVAGLRELGAQQRGGVGLREELRLEVEPRREVEIRVRRPRVAVDAAVLAALVRIDRLRERDVRRIVAADDRARRLDPHDRLQRRRLVVAVRRRRPARPSRRRPARAARAEAVCRIEGRAAALGRRGRGATELSAGVRTRAPRPS